MLGVCIRHPGSPAAVVYTFGSGCSGFNAKTSNMSLQGRLPHFALAKVRHGDVGTNLSEACIT